MGGARVSLIRIPRRASVFVLAGFSVMAKSAIGAERIP